MPKDKSDFFKIKNNWSVIKDRLLGCYLTPYFQKILKTRRPTYYIDCFAGKGKFEDGSDGSPLIALKIQNDCLNRSTEQKKYGAIKNCFIDLRVTSLSKGVFPKYNSYIDNFSIPITCSVFFIFKLNNLWSNNSKSFLNLLSKFLINLDV